MIFALIALLFVLLPTLTISLSRLPVISYLIAAIYVTLNTRHSQIFIKQYSHLTGQNVFRFKAIPKTISLVCSVITPILLACCTVGMLYMLYIHIFVTESHKYAILTAWKVRTFSFRYGPIAILLEKYVRMTIVKKNGGLNQSQCTSDYLQSWPKTPEQYKLASPFPSPSNVAILTITSCHGRRLQICVRDYVTNEIKLQRNFAKKSPSTFQCYDFVAILTMINKNKKIMLFL